MEKRRKIKLLLYLEKLLKLSTMKSIMLQSYNVLEKNDSKRFILPTTLNRLMKEIGNAQSRNQALRLILKQQQIRSITADNGTKFNRLSDVFSKEHIYYTHPYDSC